MAASQSGPGFRIVVQEREPPAPPRTRADIVAASEAEIRFLREDGGAWWQFIDAQERVVAR